MPCRERTDFLKSLATGEASDAAPRRHGGLLLGLLNYDDDDDVYYYYDDDVFDEEVD